MIQQTLEWKNLFAHQNEWKNTKLADLFTENPARNKQYQLYAANLTLNFSRTHITDKTLNLLQDLAKKADLAHYIQAMFAGENINITENRPVLHTLLRATNSIEKLKNWQQEIAQVLQQMQNFCEHEAKKFSDVVHIGIGGSALGPELVTQALAPYQTNKINCHFVANIDPANLHEILKKLNPETTLFILASKSFSTEETLCNAKMAKAWLLKKISENEMASHFIAVTANPEKAKAWGILEKNIFKFWDWVGGRYSLWSAIGLPIALNIGMENFKKLLAGANLMDEHFQTADCENNLPVIFALIGLWYRNFFATTTQAIIPYSYSLRSLPLYLQQLEMESNGKHVTLQNDLVNYKTVPIIWGSEGTNSQHSYHQWLHQGTDLTPVDFILAKESHYDMNQHKILYANCLAQAEVLCYGQTMSEPYRCLPGNRPSVLIEMEKLTPETLGALLALYEHKVFVQGIIWQINSFDQWGVEAGKLMAKKILAENFIKHEK